jgi:sugar fermentation stimulation protein A
MRAGAALKVAPMLAVATPILPAPIFVPYEAELQRGTLLDRRDRFIAKVRLPTGDVEAHCVNPGRMEAFVDAGASVWLLPAPDTAAGRARKLRYTWEAIERRDERAGDGRPIMCGANTQRPNALVRAALEARCLAGLDAWTHLKPEPKFQIRVCTSDGRGAVHSGRADFKLTTCSGGGGSGGSSRSEATGMATEHEHYVEVKNCHLVYEDGWAYFP